MLLSALSNPLPAMTPQERRQYLERLLQILPDVPSFKQWLDKDWRASSRFRRLPKVNGLPDPLTFPERPSR